MNALAGTSRLSKAHGFSLLELILVIVLIGLLIAAAIRHIKELTPEAERASVQHTLGALRSAVGIKFAHYMATRDQGAIRQMPGINPIEYMVDPPNNYLGVSTQGKPGFWYYNVNSKVLVYQARNRSHFSGGAKNPPRARFQTQLLYALDKRGRRQGIEGVRIVAIEPYTWTPRQPETMN